MLIAISWTLVVLLNVVCFTHIITIIDIKYFKVMWIVCIGKINIYIVTMYKYIVKTLNK